MTNIILLEKSDTGCPHIWFDEGKPVSVKPRCGHLLCDRSTNKSLRNLLVVTIVAIASVAGAGVYDNVFFWSKGMATDLNGDGLLQEDEMRQSLNGRAAFNIRSGSGRVQYTNEWAWIPARGVRRYVNALYFPQEVVITNEANNSGYGWPNTIELPNSVVSAITTASEAHYAIHMRFRPERVQPHPSHSWLFTFGRASNPNRGLMFGFSGTFEPTDHHYTAGGVQYHFTNYLSTAFIYVGSAGRSVDGSYCKIQADTWNDIVLSVDSNKLSVLHSRDNHLFDGFSSITNSNLGGYTQTYYEIPYEGADYDLKPVSTAEFRIGAENYMSGSSMWTNNISNNGWKAFRGSIQCLALWTNSLTKAQMLEAAAYPRTDLWRVGLENGTADEFFAAESGAQVKVDDDQWAVPALSSGNSVSFKFPLNTTGEAKMNSFIRLKTTADSPSARMEVKVNGLSLGSKPVNPGTMEWWFVDVSKVRLIAGATNDVTILRVDNGSGQVKIDSVRYGGSLQYGEQDKTSYDFNPEGHTQGTYNSVFDLMGANWAVGSRAIFTTGQGAEGTGDAGKSTAYTNQVIRFSMPDDLGLVTRYTLTWASGGTGNIQLNLNGHDLYTTPEAANGFGVLRTVEVPEEYLQANDNILKFMNVMLRKDSGSDRYASIDFIRINAKRPRSGLVIIVH